MPVRHFVSLDGWRGAAALIVALFHFSTAAQLSSTAFIRNSWLLVDFFFVLSGFVIAANYRERLAQGFAIDRFMLLRLGRLYPLHAVMLAAFVATELMLVLLSGDIAARSGRAYFGGRTSIVGIFKSLFLVQGLGSEDDIAWNGVSWSVATEIWAYLVFALLASRCARRLELAMAGLIMASLVFLLPEGLRPAWTIHFVNLARCFYGFSVGVLLQAVFERLGGDARAATLSDWRFTVLELLATGIAIAFVTSAMFLPRHLIAPLAFAPMVLVFAYDRGGLSRWLGKPPFVSLGTLSYSIYMIHGFVQSRVMLPVAFAIDKLTGMRLISIETTSEGSRYVWGTTEAGGLLAIAAMAGLVVASSWLTYRFIEAPGRDGMRRLVTRNRPGVALVA